ncbi:M14 family metallopeptidase [Tepidibacillus infernus]|uniref:M14 family metallopeptidase n=1 Tax=Tepidibacillus TaxID=1494427 RepID=UPI0009EA9F81|nr:M14 family metallopeptidase [Tepidibacillus decaturensis]
MDIRKIFTTEGFLADRNQDGVTDALTVSVQIEQQLVVYGIIDFLARLGLETSELTFPIIDKQLEEGDWLFLIRQRDYFDWSREDQDLVNSEASLFLDEDKRTVILEGNNETSIDKMLRWLAAYWPEGVSCNEEQRITKLEWRLNQVFAINDHGDQSPIQITNDRQTADQLPKEKEREELEWKPLDSLSQLWTEIGFYQGGRVDLNSQLNIGFEFSLNQPHHFMIKESAHLAAKLGLYATGIKFPITGFDLTQDKTNKKELIFKFIECSQQDQPKGDTPNGAELLLSQPRQTTSELDHQALLPQIIELKGTADGITAMIQYLNQTYPVAEGGSFGRWEQELLNQDHKPIDFPLWKKWEWHNQGELNDFKQWWEQIKVELRKNYFHHSTVNQIGEVEEKEFVERINLEVFLSEPYQIRKALETQLAEELAQLFSTTNNNTITVHIYSAYKPGFHWIKEQLSEELKKLQVNHSIDRLKIYFQKETRENGLELEIRWLQEMYPIDQWLEKHLGIQLDHIEWVMKEDLESTYFLEAYHDYQCIGTWSLNVPVAPMLYLNDQYSYPTTGNARIILNEKEINAKQISTDRERFWREYRFNVLPQIEKLIQEQLSKDTYIESGLSPLFHSLEVHVWLSEEEERLNIQEERISALEALHEDLYFFTLDYFADLGKRITGQEWNSPGAIKPFLHLNQNQAPKAEIILRRYQPRPKRKMKTTKLWIDHQNPEQLIAVVEEETDPRQTPIQHQVPIKINNDTNHHKSQVHVFEWTVKHSFEGRPIQALEVTSHRVSQFRSTHKLSLFKPTILIETGHHANEVSSMPAIKELVTEIINQHPDWLKRVNLVVIPQANPDGVALHQRLTAEHPEWKHHAARFNAVGLEYAYHRFKETLFGEAEVVPTLFYRWLPDVIIDDHGIPSHEWTQPFAGYNSPPRFPVSYWIPISLIYGITKKLDQDKYPKHYQILQQVIKEINRGFEQSSLQQKNRQYQLFYQRYGHQWCPETFPLEKESELIFYEWPTQVDQKSTSLIARHPEWVTLDIISEAADETVYDQALRECMDAHQVFDRSIIGWIANRPQSVTKISNNGWIRWFRKRPLQ